jgi:hypothetical protein
MASTDDAASPRSPRLPKVGKLTIVGYGSFSWGLFAADTLVNMFFLQFLLDFGKVDPTIAGFVLCVFLCRCYFAVSTQILRKISILSDVIYGPQCG